MSRNFFYSMTNSDVSNEVIAYELDGSNLVRIGAFETRGQGTGNPVVDPLVSQGSIVISRACNLLFAVNAGSNTISVFKILYDGSLLLITVVSSFGTMPIALSTYGNFLAVANRGDVITASNISLFTFSCSGYLRVACPPNYRLSNPMASPSSLTINPVNLSENQILVAELNLSRISVFNREECGLSCPVVNDSVNSNPFPIVALDNGILLSVEVGSSTITSYSIEENGVLTLLDSVATNGNASCWLSVTPSNGYAYVSNTGSGTISVFAVDPSGMLTFIETIDSVPGGGAAPIDSSISADGAYLYVLNGDVGSISAFRINGDGTLTFVDVIEDTLLPGPGAQGMAAL